MRPTRKVYRFTALGIVALQLGMAMTLLAQKPQSRPARKLDFPSPAPLTARQIVDKVLPSLLVVLAQNNQGETISQGSGFIYKSGFGVTNLHVFKRAMNAVVHFVGGKVTYKVAGIVGIDRRRDLCIFRIQNDFGEPLVFNSSLRPSVGDEVYAFGNPKGLEGTVSKGIVSGIRSDSDKLQIDAAISAGSSGGPIVNSRGEVIGVAVSSVVSGQNLNFAIPVEFVNAIPSDQLKGSDRMLNDIDKIIGHRPSVSVRGAGAVAVTDREEEDLLGPVQSFFETVSDMKYDERTRKYVEEARRETVMKASFDQFGNLTESWTHLNGEPIAKHSRSYDSWGMLTSVTSEALYTAGKRDLTQFTPVESIERKMKLINPAGTFEDIQWKWVYDLSGNPVESTFKLSPKMTTLRTYDKNGLLVDVKDYMDGRLSKARRYTYEFDYYGNWTRSLQESFDSKFPSFGYVPMGVQYRNLTYFR